MTPSLRAALNPASVAVIGASENPDKIGGRPLFYLARHGYRGTVFAVNPRRDDLRAALRCLSAPMLDIEDLSRLAADGLSPAPLPPAHRTGRIIVEHRLGHRLDVI